MSGLFAEPASAAVRTRALLLFLLAAAVTAVSVGLNLAFPALAPTGTQQTATRLIIHAAILVGLWLGLSRTALGARSRLVTWLALAVPLTAWLALIWWLAVDGAFRVRPGAGVPALPVAIFLPLLVGVPLLLCARRVGTILDATPPSWLVGLQVYRVFGSVFLVAWAQGNLPGTFALPAGIGDVTVGLLALPVAVYLHSGARGGRAAAVAWNVLGIVDLVNAVTIGLLSTPGPLQLIVPNPPSALLGTFPTVMIPAFAIPSSIMLHALSLRQLRRLARILPAGPASAAARRPATAMAEAPGT
ncbi:MAG TPA: MFS transporter [Chloroflexota bacterium]|jgi:hypothetical protein